ncbi:hypothetical protein [Arthrobacter sp. MW3 TE3886]|uniref:hypothetical protein n=1 Tax=Arthrobacter sp. MW3 TE3886 TaxID=3156254 RepID=UPI0035169133
MPQKNKDWAAAANQAARDATKKDWAAEAAEAAKRNAERLTDSATMSDRVTAGLESSLDHMRKMTQGLDPELQVQALRIVEANEEWIQAQDKKLDALERKDEKAAAKEQKEQERLEREIQSFQLLKGMHDAAKATAKALEEIRKARRLADRQQGQQATFNKKMAWVALFVAMGSFIASVGMPLADHAFFNDPPKVAVVDYWELTVPPLLRNLHR